MSPAASKASSIRRNDRQDTDRVEAKLISIGHHLVRFARLKGLMVSDRTLFWEAAEIVWQAKREYRAELRVRRAQRAAVARATFAKVAA
jgi:predicted metal-dependent hydrolase